MPVVACRVVALRPHALDVEVWSPALECARALLDAAHCVVAGEEGAVGEADAGVDFFSRAVVDYGGFVVADTMCEVLRRSTEYLALAVVPMYLGETWSGLITGGSQT